MTGTTRLQRALERVADWDRHHIPLTPKPIMAADHGIRPEDRLAHSIIDFAGSMRFVYLHTAWFAVWVAVNAGLLVAMGFGVVPFDPFPFGFLTLVVSLEAIFLSTFVMSRRTARALCRCTSRG